MAASRTNAGSRPGRTLNQDFLAVGVSGLNAEEEELPTPREGLIRLRRLVCVVSDPNWVRNELARHRGLPG